MKKSVKFLRRYPPYMKGDTATFDEERSDAIIEAGLAVEHKFEKKPKAKNPKPLSKVKRQMEADTGSSYVTK